MTDTYVPIPLSEQPAATYPIPWRCWCGAYFGTYDLSEPADDPQRTACEHAAKAHRATHRKEGTR